RNVIDRGGMHRVHHPDAGNKERRNSTHTGRARIIILPETAVAAKQKGQQPKQQQACGHVQKNVGEMETGRVGIPKEIIDHVGKILDRSIMTRIGIKKEIVTEGLEREERTFYKWIVPGEE